MIEEFLKHNVAFLDYGSRKLLWDMEEWMVIEFTTYAAKSKRLYRGENLEKALEVLKGED